MHCFFFLSERCHTAHHITALCIILVLLSCTPSGKKKIAITTCSTTRSIELTTLRNRFAFPTTICPVGPTLNTFIIASIRMATPGCVQYVLENLFVISHSGTAVILFGVWTFCWKPTRYHSYIPQGITTAFGRG